MTDTKEEIREITDAYKRCAAEIVGCLNSQLTSAIEAGWTLKSIASLQVTTVSGLVDLIMETNAKVVMMLGDHGRQVESRLSEKMVSILIDHLGECFCLSEEESETQH